MERSGERVARMGYHATLEGEREHEKRFRGARERTPQLYLFKNEYSEETRKSATDLTCIMCESDLAAPRVPTLAVRGGSS